MVRVEKKQWENQKIIYEIWKILAQRTKQSEWIEVEKWLFNQCVSYDVFYLKEILWLLQSQKEGYHDI